MRPPATHFQFRQRAVSVQGFQAEKGNNGSFENGVCVAQSSQTFTDIGAPQTFSIATGITQIKVKLTDSSGPACSVIPYNLKSVNGATVVGILNISQYTSLYVYVGGKRGNSAGAAGGWNGGGKASNASLGKGGGLEERRVSVIRRKRPEFYDKLTRNILLFSWLKFNSKLSRRRHNLLGWKYRLQLELQIISFEKLSTLILHYFLNLLSDRMSSRTFEGLSFLYIWNEIPDFVLFFENHAYTFAVLKMVGTTGFEPATPIPPE